MVSKSTPSAPPPQDPNVTAAAQTKSNQQTALFNFGLNNPNTYSPLGSSTFQATGADANGSPTYAQTISLSPQEQALFNQNTANTLQQGQTAGTALNNVSNLMNTPFNLQGNIPQTLSGGDQQKDLQNAQDALYHQQTQYLDPQFQQGQQQLESQLANEGIPMGSAAYQTAMDNFARQKQQAYQSAQDSATSGGAAYQAQLANTGLANQAQQAQLYTQQYQEPLNLYSSLMSGTQPTLPQFSGANTAQAAPTNVLGAYQNAYNQQLNQYNAKQGASNSLESGLFGLGGSAMQYGLPLLAASDRRLKKEIRKIGKYKKGFTKYMFKYVWDDIFHIGPMADEVKKVIPEAVITNNEGYYFVNYNLIGD